MNADQRRPSSRRVAPPLRRALAGILLVAAAAGSACLSVSRQEEIRMGRDYAERLDREREPNALEALFASHPLTEERIRRVQELIDRIPPSRLEGLRSNSPAFDPLQAALEAYPPPPEEYRIREDG